MRAATTRLFSLLVSLLFLVGAIVVYALLLKPAYADINTLRGELTARSETLETQLRITEEVKNLLQTYQGVVNDYKQTISFAIPIGEEYPVIFSQTDFLARNAGLVLESMNVTVLPFKSSGGRVGSVQSPVVGTLQLQINLIGPYSAFKTFTRSIESNIRVMDIMELSISPSLVSQNFSYNMTVNTYYQSLQ